MDEDNIVRCCEDATMPFLDGAVWYCPTHLVEEFGSRLADIGINLELHPQKDYTVVITDIPSRIKWEGELYEYDPGKLYIELHYDPFYRARLHVYIRGDSAHPHISSSGEACMGRNGQIISNAVKNMDFVAAYAQSMAMLCSYNKYDAYHPIAETDECYECGSTYEVYECDNCGRSMCEEHRGTHACCICGVQCEDCEEYFPKREVYRCENCGAHICHGCAKIVGKSVYCHSCEDEARENYERDLRADGEVSGDE